MTERSVLAPPGIFKAYDIRGLYGAEMDEATALAIGRAFARVLGRLRGKAPSELRIGLGRDMRLTAPAMAAELRDGLIFEGATVVDAGMVATEMLYHLVGSRAVRRPGACTTNAWVICSGVPNSAIAAWAAWWAVRPASR